MNVNASFLRKVSYVAAIALLLIPLFLLGQPATRQSGGGKLAQLRSTYNLSQAELGEIDPASESMKLATLGMRGVAANILWSKANHYKKHEDWDKLSATLNQITKLQPNFIKVWEFQAHNLSYNTSVEFDDYRHRYHWVKKGIDFLITGTRYNRNEPRLLWNVGWFTGQKIGRADEHRQFRRMFRTDTDFHNLMNNYVDVDSAAGADGYPDNWLVGQLWYLQAQTVVDTQGVPVRGKSPLIFHADIPMSRINYASTIEKEGYLDEKAKIAWQLAGRQWHQYGARQLPTSWGHSLRLNDLEAALAEGQRLAAELDALAPGAREQLHQQKLAQLSSQHRSALEMPQEQWDEETYSLVQEAQQRVAVSHQEVAEQVSGPDRTQARKLALRAEEADTLAQRIRHYRQIVNFDYWRTRCEVEQTDTAIDARKYVYEAEELYDQTILVAYQEEEDGPLQPGAKELYEAAWVEWAKIFDDYPELMEDITADDLVDSVNRYRRLLQDLDEPFPEDFELQKLLDVRQQMHTQPAGDPAADDLPDELSYP